MSPTGSGARSASPPPPLLSWLIFDEGLTGPMVLGLGLVIAGVLLVELGSHRARVAG